MTSQSLNRACGVDVLASYIRTRDKRITKDQPWSTTPPLNYYVEMLARGNVRVGGRATCGSYTDPSWKAFRAWNEVVSKARKLGFVIGEVDIKQPNGWATKAGGFWNESEFSAPVDMALRDALLAAYERSTHARGIAEAAA